MTYMYHCPVHGDFSVTSESDAHPCPVVGKRYTRMLDGVLMMQCEFREAVHECRYPSPRSQGPQ